MAVAIVSITVAAAASALALSKRLSDASTFSRRALDHAERAVTSEYGLVPTEEATSAALRVEREDAEQEREDGTIALWRLIRVSETEGGRSALIALAW